MHCCEYTSRQTIHSECNTIGDAQSRQSQQFPSCVESVTMSTKPSHPTFQLQFNFKQTSIQTSIQQQNLVLSPDPHA